MVCKQGCPDPLFGAFRVSRSPRTRQNFGQNEDLYRSVALRNTGYSRFPVLSCSEYLENRLPKVRSNSEYQGLLISQGTEYFEYVGHWTAEYNSSISEYLGYLPVDLVMPELP